MNIKHIFLLILATITFGCKERNDGGGSDSTTGNVQLSVATDSRTADHFYESTRAVSDELIYRLTILDKSGEEVATYDDCLSAGDIRLAIGDYTFIVESGEDHSEPLVDAPYYYGESEVSIKGGESTLVHITTKLANARISAKFSDVLMDENLFSDVTFSIGDQTLTREMVKAGSSIFVDDEMDGFTWKVKVTNVQGLESELSQERRTIEECAHYTFSFDVEEVQNETDGYIGVEIIIDNIVTVFDDDIEINIEKKEAPELTTVGFVSGVQKIIRDITPRDSQLEFHFEVYAGAKEITIRHENDALEAAGLPKMINLSAITTEIKSIANSMGIEWTTPIYENVNPVVTFTKFAEKAGLGEYQFFVELIDKDDQFVEGDVSFAILPDMEHLTISSQNGAKYAVLNGEWCSLVKPEGLSFQYRVKGNSEWTLIDESLINITSLENKQYSTRIVDLTPLTTYEFRSYSSSVVYENRIKEFTTEDAPEIPNLDFEQSYWSGKYWYPNASDGNSYWATGNEGLVASPVSQNSNTHDTDDAVSGKAVVMESVKINLGISPVKFAAGNLFTGGYKTNMSNPKASAKMGRPYTGRPLQLKGYYKYFPADINNDKNGVAGSGYGKPDYCHIYISLEDWGDPNATSRPSNPRVIGYGEFKTNQTVDTYSQFTIDIDYAEDRKPTHVVLLATSSHLGEDFAGGNGSKLYIDEFELVWQ